MDDKRQPTHKKPEKQDIFIVEDPYFLLEQFRAELEDTNETMSKPID